MRSNKIVLLGLVAVFGVALVLLARQIVTTLQTPPEKKVAVAEKRRPFDNRRNSDEKEFSTFAKTDSSAEFTLPQEVLDVPVRPMFALSGASKKAVYDLRKEAVKASPFARAGYEPSAAVFGGIESYKPWIAADLCKDEYTHTHKTKGPSEETRFINNPTMLVALEYPFVFSGRDAAWCTRADANVLPQKITYDGPRREITVTYQALPFLASKNGTFYAFNGVNARDLGYPYVYLDLGRSTYFPVFTNEPNISNEAVEMQNYIHVGFSCGAKGGCNNGSPRQPMLEFTEDLSASRYPNGRELYLKLWRHRPDSVEDPADIVERIILLNPEENSVINK